MGFHPINLDAFHIGYTVLSAFVVIFGMFSLFLKERLYIGEAVWATVFGIIVGPYCAGIFDPRDWGSADDRTTNRITLEVTRVVLAVGVFAIGVELPKSYVGRHWKSLTFLLVPVMVVGWFICAGLIYALIPRLDFLSSLAVAACLTPTDPILAAAVVGGRYAEKHVPEHLRHLLAAESGVNDGAAFPMLFIALYLILERDDGTAVGEWFYITWVYEIILGTILGALLGYGFRHLMKFCERRDLIDRHSYVAQYISLALLSNGITTILGSDDLLASFACGTAFAYDGWFNKKTEESLFSNVIDLIFNCACFIYIGAWIPFSEFNSEETGLTPWRLVVIALLVIAVRRLPIMVALYKWIPEIKTLREAVFSGHFGPMGVGAVFISTLALEEIPEFSVHDSGRAPETQLEFLAATMQPIIAFIVLVSIAIHGLSIPFFSLGRRVHSISRTWSRHTSMDPNGLPEWASQARHVKHGEDIVINRDSEPQEADITTQKMERGELALRRTGSYIRTPSGSSGGDETEKRRHSEDGVGKNRENELERQPGGEGEDVPEGPSGQDAPPGERPPGETTEWREGHDLVVERAVGDGEEVEVEVIRNHFTDDNPMSKVVRGAKDNVRAHMKADMHRLQMATGLSPQTSRGSHSTNARSPTPDVQVLREWTPVEAGQRQSSSSLTAATPPKAEEPASSNHGITITRRSPSPTPSQKSSSSSVKRRASKPESSSRRQSFRRHIFGRKRHQHKPSDISVDEDYDGDGDDHDTGAEDDERGRELSPTTSSNLQRVRSNEDPHNNNTTSTSTASSAANPAILRARLNHQQHMSRRSESPGRSIRFADSALQRDDGSSTSLSRLVSPGSHGLRPSVSFSSNGPSPSPSNLISGASENGDENSRGVTFDLSGGRPER